MQSLEWEVLYFVQRPHAVSTKRGHVGLPVFNAIFKNKGVYHTDVNINFHAKNSTSNNIKNVIKYAVINIFSQ